MLECSRGCSQEERRIRWVRVRRLMPDVPGIELYKVEIHVESLGSYVATPYRSSVEQSPVLFEKAVIVRVMIVAAVNRTRSRLPVSVISPHAPLSPASVTLFAWT